MAQTSRLVIELDSRDAETKAADTRKALEALEDAGLAIQPALNKAGAGMESMGKSADKASKSVSAEADELEQLLGQIDPVIRRLGDLDKQEQALAKHRNAAGSKLDKATYDEYQAKINQTRAKLTQFDDSLTRTGNTAKQTAAALRGVPAQFTDIAVSLQGGQNPLTVFLQQGGQLKDMFGGVGPAAKAMGGYILGLVNPFTVAAAAVGTLGLAYYQGSKEADAYRLGIVTTGNAAGTSALALAGMATTISASVGTTGKAAETLALLASNGKIASTSFEQIASAAIGFEQVTGKAVADTVAEFAALAEDPVKTLATLNDKYNFLTASVYEQVRAAEQMGEKEQAAAIAQDAYAKALEARTKTIKESLGTIETAWNAITGAAKSGWDAMLGVGRQQSLDEQIANTKQLLEDRKDSFAAKMFPGTLGADSDSTRFLQTRLSLLEKQKLLLTDQGKAEGDNARIQRDGQKAYEDFQKGIEAGGTREQKLNKALLEDQKRINAARAAGYTIAQADADASEKAIRDKYKEPKTPKGPAAKAYTEDAGMKMLDSARQTNAVLTQQLASINGQGIATEKVGAQAQALIKWEQQLADIKSKQTLTADQKSLLASQDLITAQLKKNAGLECEAEIQKGIKQANDDQVKLLTLTGQLREANQLKSGLDDAAQMAEYERQGNTEAAKRLETMIKIRDINLQSAQKPGTVEGVSQAPAAAGLDASVGGAFSEIDRLDADAAKIDQWRATELQKQQAYLDLKAINEETYAERIGNIEQQATQNRQKIEEAKNQALLVGASDFFGNMASLSQSGNKKLAAIGKAAAIVQATMDGYLAVQKALAAFPPPFNFAAAAAVGVATAANVANIAGIGFSDGGYTGSGGVNDPAGTVHKGEVVWSQKDIRKFGGVAAVEALRKGNVSPIQPGAKGSGPDSTQMLQGSAPVVNIHEDASRAGQSRSSQIDGKWVTDYFVANIRENGKEAKAIQQMLGVGRAIR
ncbi:phage tail length tape measure family protein [Pseudomonas rustica]|uniref:Phage tail length tape measure family protein n=1 Tax=Pseudomonas rustica TaxID=2827099 RepID=A0ABS5N464_9PSED|nr:phage tail length tape measure family protein [Pseudomonas rustica]MBS4081358.1 phage tail length tape measure family protein [Pseudomonas rustica]